MDGSKILWWVLQLCWIWCLGLVHTKLMRLGFWIFEKLHSGPELWPFENGLTKSGTKAPILRQIWRWPSLNGHNSVPRGPIDLNSFPMDRPLPGLGDGHRKWPKSPFLARVISVQKIPTKWYFWAFFYETASLFWFSLFLLPLSWFWPFSFKLLWAALRRVKMF